MKISLSLKVSSLTTSCKILSKLETTLVASISHPPTLLKQNQGQGQPAWGSQSIVQTLKLLFEPSNVALLQPIIRKQNFPDSFFYHFPPQNTQRERFTRTRESLKVNMRLKRQTEFRSVQNYFFMTVKETGGRSRVQQYLGVYDWRIWRHEIIRILGYWTSLFVL